MKNCVNTISIEKFTSRAVSSACLETVITKKRSVSEKREAFTLKKPENYCIVSGIMFRNFLSENILFLSQSMLS